MTNAQKYLKDGVDIGQLARKITELNWSNDDCLEDNITMYFRQEATPTLTEDERVILKKIHSNENYKTYKTIGRTTYGSLYLTYELNKETARELGELETDNTEFEMYNNLFQFIKEGEEYYIEGLLKGEKA